MADVHSWTKHNTYGKVIAKTSPTKGHLVKKLNNKGFSVLEIATVIAVLAVVGVFASVAFKRVTQNNSSNAGASSYIGKVKHYQNFGAGDHVAKVNGVTYMIISPKEVAFTDEHEAQRIPKNMKVQACAHFRNIDSRTKVHIKALGTDSSHDQAFYGKTTYNICTPYFSSGSKGRTTRIMVITYGGKVGVDTMYYKR